MSNQRSRYGGAVIGAAVLLAVGVAYFPGHRSAPMSTTPPEVVLDYAGANLPNPALDGYAFQAAILARIPQVIDRIHCYCSCDVSLKVCYERRACPPT